jgi:hypothetical protein
MWSASENDRRLSMAIHSKRSLPHSRRPLPRSVVVGELVHGNVASRVGIEVQLLRLLPLDEAGPGLARLAHAITARIGPDAGNAALACVDIV